MRVAKKSNAKKRSARKSNGGSFAGVAAIAIVGVVGWAIVARPGTTPLVMPADSTASGVFQPTVPNGAPPPSTAPEGMVWIPGGEFSMGVANPHGTDMNDVGMHATDDSRPIHRVSLDGFWMDRTEVTNAQFETFVTATGHVTVAERTPRAEDFPGYPSKRWSPVLCCSRRPVGRCR